jgi:hypothetical protein
VRNSLKVLEFAEGPFTRPLATMCAAASLTAVRKFIDVLTTSKVGPGAIRPQRQGRSRRAPRQGRKIGVTSGGHTQHVIKWVEEPGELDWWVICDSKLSLCGTITIQISNTHEVETLVGIETVVNARTLADID